MAEEPTSKENLPPGAEIDPDGLWSQVLNRAQGATRRAALFLDRDGVVVEDVHYLHRPEDVSLIDGACAVIAEANRRAIPVVMVTNQAGIAHGHYGWAEFIQVQEKILDDLAAEGAFVNGVFACPHHDGGRAPYDVENHPWRKPNPGMLLAAAERLPLDLGQSWIIGDRAGDLEAGKNAALAGGLHVLSGHGADGGERDSALALAGSRFQTLLAPTIAGAIFQLPLFQSVVDGAP